MDPSDHLHIQCHHSHTDYRMHMCYLLSSAAHIQILLQFAYNSPRREVIGVGNIGFPDMTFWQHKNFPLRFHLAINTVTPILRWCKLGLMKKNERNTNFTACVIIIRNTWEICKIQRLQYFCTTELWGFDQLLSSVGNTGLHFQHHLEWYTLATPSVRYTRNNLSD